MVFPEPQVQSGVETVFLLHRLPGLAHLVAASDDPALNKIIFWVCLESLSIFKSKSLHRAGMYIVQGKTRIVRNAVPKLPSATKTKRSRRESE